MFGDFQSLKPNPDEHRIQPIGASQMLSIMDSVAQFERAMIKERQKEGIAKAKQKGVYKGRVKTVDDAAIRAHVAAGNSIRKTAEAFGVNPSTVQRAMKAE
nr:recombinase family protein [Pseudomonas aeruginosa]